jgi:sensor domain CHASE-containing protein
MSNNTLCNSVEEVFRVKVLGFYIYFLMIVNTSIVVWHTLGDHSHKNIKKELSEKSNTKRKWFFTNNID